MRTSRHGQCPPLGTGCPGNELRCVPLEIRAPSAPSAHQEMCVSVFSPYAVVPENGPGPNRSLRIDRAISRTPIRRTEPARLEPFQHPQHLLRTAADVQIVNHGILQYACRIDDEQASRRQLFLLDPDTVRTRDGALDVGSKWNWHSIRRNAAVSREVAVSTLCAAVLVGLFVAFVSWLAIPNPSASRSRNG